MPEPLKPPALQPGDGVRILSAASPVEESLLAKGIREVERMGFAVVMDRAAALARDGYFAGSTLRRLAALEEALAERVSCAIFCSRGGYGSNYLLGGLSPRLSAPKIVLGHSDLTSLQIWLWQNLGWVTLHGPMIAAGLASGAGAPNGYESESLLRALCEAQQGWSIDLDGECMFAGSADGVLLGGCLTLVETTLGTPWELGTEGSILVLEDRGMRPYQVDRALMHLKQAGKFESVGGVILGEFPECEAPAQTESVRQVAQRILEPLGVPVVWGAAVGHTSRPMLTLPLGVRAHLKVDARSGTQLEILEPACSAGHLLGPEKL